MCVCERMNVNSLTFYECATHLHGWPTGYSTSDMRPNDLSTLIANYFLFCIRLKILSTISGWFIVLRHGANVDWGQVVAMGGGRTYQIGR